jgi:hypothetical protein
MRTPVLAGAFIVAAEAISTATAPITEAARYVRTTKDDLRSRLVDRQNCDAYQWRC